MGEAASDQYKTPLLEAQPINQSPLIRSGNVWTAVAHIITGVLGSGVLSLSWSTAQLGWIAGPLTMVCFALITLFSAFLLCNCYRSPDPVHGPDRNRSYLEAVRMYLGEMNAWVCGSFVQVSLYGIAIAYTVTSGISMRAIQKSNCYHKEGHEAACEYGDTFYMLLFGIVQIVLSQVPDFHNIKWLSIVAAFMSFAYSFIGLGLGIATVIANGYAKGSVKGITAPSSEKVWLISQAIGDVAFAYPYSIILIEIQDTLKSPPAENKTMKKASTIAIIVTTFFYLCCGSFGYAAFGDDTPGNLLTGFGFYEPYWLIDFANTCIVLHLIGGYQVYSQPLFASFEKWFTKKFDCSRFVNNYNLKIPLLPEFNVNPLRLCFRSAYVVSTTAIAMAFPYFNQLLGVLGGLNYWPLTIYFPVEMYLKQANVEAWTAEWITLRVFSMVGFVVILFALIGSFEGLVTAKLS